MEPHSFGKETSETEKSHVPRPPPTPVVLLCPLCRAALVCLLRHDRFLLGFDLIGILGLSIAEQTL
jgi:hypothetical protein